MKTRFGMLKKLSSAACVSLAMAGLASTASHATTVSLTQLDLNDDLVINGLDVGEIRKCWNQLASCNPDADFNDDGSINFLDYQILVGFYGQIVPSADVSISADAETFVPLGESVNTVYSVEFTTGDSTNYNLSYDQASTCLGLTVDNNSGSVFPASLDSPTVLVVNETLSDGILEEDCTLTKTVTIDELGIVAEHQMTVHVIPETGTPELSSPTALPSGIPPSENTDVLFNVKISGTTQAPTSVAVHKVDDAGADLGEIAPLLDDGVVPDLVAGDSVFTGAATLFGSTLGKILFRAEASFPSSGLVLSDVSELLVTSVPVGLASGPVSTVVDPVLNEEVVQGQALAQVADDTTPEDAETAVEWLGYSVLGYEPALNTMLVGFPTSQTPSDVIAALQALPEFASAEANGVDVISEFVPNDTNYGSQYGFPKTRADEAWVITRGANVMVGVIDTGADLDHPDLTANLVKSGTFKGYDAVDGDTVPEDANSHGTHVSGTVAADTNNSTQVAGMAPNAKLLIVRTLGPGGGSHAQFADGVKKATDYGVKIISYSGGGSHSTTKQNAVNYAVGKGVLFIAAAGNDTTSAVTSAYPAAYGNVMAIGSTDSSDGRSTFSNFGTWVTMAAPGTGILSLNLAGGTTTKSGTSMATPHVSGVAALVWSAHPTLTAAQVQDRLVKSAKPLASTLQLGAGRLDAFSAVFNSSFEMGGLKGWSKSGTASSEPALGPLTPQEGARMALVSTGPGGDFVSTSMYQDFTVQSDVTSIPVQFTYNFVTEEYPEFVGTQFNDCTQIRVQTPLGTTYVLAHESVNGSVFSSVGGIDFPGGDNTVGQTGWKTVAVDIPAVEGPGTYRVFVSDAGDDIYDSVLLLDDIRLKASVSATSPLTGLACE